MPATKYGLGKTSDAIELTLPSRTDPDDPNSPHNVCRVRRPGVQGLIAAGVLDDFDSLTAIVQLEHVPRAAGRPIAVEDLAKSAKALVGNTDKLLGTFAMMDKIVAFTVIEPQVWLPPEPAEEGGPVPERDPDRLYTDEVDLTDRLFIMQFAVGGVQDLERFRQETAAIVDAVEAQPDVPVSAVGVDGDNGPA